MEPERGLGDSGSLNEDGNDNGEALPAKLCVPGALSSAGLKGSCDNETMTATTS